MWFLSFRVKFAGTERVVITGMALNFKVNFPAFHVGAKNSEK